MPLNRKKKTEPRAVRPAPAKSQEKTSEPSRPAVVRSHEQRSGCLGAFMYFLFVVCLSVAIAFFLWMAANDALSLNKSDFEASVSLP
ncbi:MAG: hypothetical protein Q4F31_02630, partial [Eubacteriales bacterium]|nr:hypothetical protein [Eubacteriales bacterium]